jgi:hypothetical protein
MKKPAITTDQCTDRFRATADALLSEGAAEETIVEGLVIVAIEAGHKSRRPEAVLDAAEKAFGNAAYVAFEGARKDRAAKRRGRLGLPKD